MHRTVLAAITAAVLTACSSQVNVKEQIALAETAIVEEDAESTRRYCDRLLADSAAYRSLEATDMARLSILYMQINERTDDHEAVDIAADCFRDAFLLDADSARIYYESLTPDNLKYAMALSSIVSSMDNPHRLDLLGEESSEFADSL